MTGTWTLGGHCHWLRCPSLRPQAGNDAPGPVVLLVVRARATGSGRHCDGPVTPSRLPRPAGPLTARPVCHPPGRRAAPAAAASGPSRASGPTRSRACVLAAGRGGRRESDAPALLEAHTTGRACERTLLRADTTHSTHRGSGSAGSGRRRTVTVPFKFKLTRGALPVPVQRRHRDLASFCSIARL